MPPEQNTPYQPTTSHMQSLAVPISIVVAGAIIGVGLYAGLSAKAPSQGGGAIKVDVKDIAIGADDPYIGSKNAPVTLVYWSDYQCPYCKAVEVGGVPQIPVDPSIPTLISDYVDTGKLRIVFKDYAFLGPDSITAALYEHAIWESNPEKFYEWREAMYVAQDEEHGGFGDEASILKLTAKIQGLDANALKALVVKNNDEYLKKIAEDQEQGSKFGVGGTPAFITGKTYIDGARDISVFKQAIDAQL